MTEEVSSPFQAADAFATMWPPHAGLSAREWAAAGCDEFPPALAFLLGLAASRIGPAAAQQIMVAAAAATAETRPTESCAPNLGLCLPALPEALPETAPEWCEVEPERVARAFARLYAEAMGGNMELERFLAAHAVAQLAIYHGGGMAELANALESVGRP